MGIDRDGSATMKPKLALHLCAAPMESFLLVEVGSKKSLVLSCKSRGQGLAGLYVAAGNQTSERAVIYLLPTLSFCNLASINQSLSQNAVWRTSATSAPSFLTFSISN